MGYRSNFTVVLHEGNKKHYKKILTEIEKESGYKFEYSDENSANLYDANWGSCEEDLAAVAARHPDTVIELDVEGEDRKDNWSARFKDTEKETIIMQYSWPPFRKIVLPKDRKETAGNSSRMHVAALIEVDADGEAYVTIHTGEDPEEVTDSIVSHFEQEHLEREINIVYNRADILSAVKTGNEHTRPLSIPVSDWDNSYILTTKVL